MFQKEYKMVNQYTNFDLNTVNVENYVRGYLNSCEVTLKLRKTPREYGKKNDNLCIINHASAYCLTPKKCVPNHQLKNTLTVHVYRFMYKHF